MSFFDAAYLGTPPWDIGRPQGEFVRLEQSGAIVGDVLDVGCGTGENAIFLAGRGHRVLGIDSAKLAVKKAKAKAAERRIEASFRVWDALRLHELAMRFDSVIDSGFFHTLTDGERIVFQRSLHSVMKPGSMYFMLVFSDEEPGWGGPRRVREEEVRVTFDSGWRVEAVDRARFDDQRGAEGARALLSRIRRV